jgi:hypothetical protein
MSNRMMGENHTLTADEWQAQADSYLREALAFEREYAGLACCESMVKLKLLDAAICEGHARLGRELDRQEAAEWLGAQAVGVMQIADSWCRQ